jgi:hypothetical protein
MPSLSEVFSTLAQNLATEVLALARKASVNEILSDSHVAGHGPGLTPLSETKSPATPALDVKRMSADTIDSVATVITRYVKSHQGSKAEAIRKELGIPKEKWARPLAFALGKKGLSKKGQKRATTYWVW